MYKFITNFVTAFVSITTFAASGDCLKDVIEVQNWPISAQEIECILKSQEFKDSLVGLCSADRKSFSTEYKAYRSYEVAYKEAFAKFQGATDDSSRSVILIDMGIIDRDWKVLGHKTEMATFLWPLSQAKYNCKGR